MLITFADIKKIFKKTYLDRGKLCFAYLESITGIYRPSEEAIDRISELDIIEEFLSKKQKNELIAMILGYTSNDDELFDELYDMAENN